MNVSNFPTLELVLFERVPGEVSGQGEAMHARKFLLPLVPDVVTALRQVLGNLDDSQPEVLARDDGGPVDVVDRVDVTGDLGPRSDAALAVAAAVAEVARLKDELQRVRAHETHLIQERDRLIHQDLKNLHQEIRALDADHKELTTQLAQRSQELRKAQEKNADLASMVNSLESRNAQLFVELTEKDAAQKEAQSLLAKVRAVDGAWMAVFDELRKAGN